MYPCRMHPDLCVAVDTVPQHSAHLYPPNVEPFEVNHSYYVNPENSPVSLVHNYLTFLSLSNIIVWLYFGKQPYGPASQPSPEAADYGYGYEDDSGGNRAAPVSMHSATTQTISAIYNPHSLPRSRMNRFNDVYFPNDDYCSYRMHQLTKAISAERIVAKKSTLV